MTETGESGPVVVDEEAAELGTPGRRPPPIPPTLPILPLRETVIFPHLPVPLAVGRPASLRLVDQAMVGAKMIGLVLQRTTGDEEPGPADLHHVGTAAVIQRLLKFPDGTVRVLVSGLERIRIRRFVSTAPFLTADVEVLPESTPASVEIEALHKNLQGQIRRLLSLMPIASEELGVALLNVDDPGRLADMTAALLVRDPAIKQSLLETLDVGGRLRALTRHLAREIEVMELGSKIQKEVETEMEKGQREFVLRQQLKAIQKELGGGDDAEAEIENLRRAIEQAGMPEGAKEAAERELNRLRTMSPASAEHSVVRTYLDWLIALPWSKQTEDKIDLKEARRILDEDHFDLEKVKERILEFLAVRRLGAGGRGPILCFAGPPGTGKTSLGRSIARAMGRPFHRLSLGGVRDEAEIRGHRRTYVGAMPGQIIQGLRKSGTRNPVFMLDEVDKLGADFRGDPASALLEVLDPEQNHTFSDHYIDLPFDLSKVLFITTANILDTIPRPLLDRMEILELPGYTDEEKVAIARRYLIPRQCAENGLRPEDLVLPDATLSRMVSRYTMEAGLRNLEREIAKIGRKIALRQAEGGAGPVTVTPEILEEYLGPPRFSREAIEQTAVPGVAVGMVWTAAGGDIVFVEATRMSGGKSLILTGQLGDVMRESAQAALSYVRSRAEHLGIERNFWNRFDLHLHVPAGAVPKDGPSAGVTLAAALASLLTGRPCRSDLAMTGEITLRGKVLEVGGIKQKVLGAHRAGIRTVVLPAENEKDLVEIPESVRGRLSFRFARTVDEVLEAALLPAPGARPPAGRTPARRGRGARRPAPGMPARG